MNTVSFFLVLILPLLLREIESQILDIDEPQGTDYYCDSDASTCNITVTGACNSDDCLSSSYHCPQSSNCQSCAIECADTKICMLGTIYSYECDNVRVFTTTNRANIMEEITIYGPKGGNLNVYVDSRESSFEHAKIYSNETHNINIRVGRISGDNVGGSMYVNARDATGALSLTCDTDCEDSTVICPDNDESSNCNINCDNTLGNFKCKNMKIYTKEGWNTVDLDCDESTYIVCDGINVYCTDDSSLACAMGYGSSWYCAESGDNKYCGGTASTNPDTTQAPDTPDDPDTTTAVTDGGGGGGGGGGGTETTEPAEPAESTDSEDGNTIGPNNENEENSVSKGDESNWFMDNIVTICVVFGAIFVVILLVVFCVRYLCKHEDKWLWVWDWMKAACRNRRQKQIPGVLPTAAVSMNTTFETHHISPVPDPAETGQAPDTLNFDSVPTNGFDVHSSLDTTYANNTVKLSEGHSNIRVTI